MSGRGKRGISYVQNEEPAFIKAFKQKVGYKEGPTIDSKRENLDYEEEDRSDTEEEKPVVVVVKEGDLTAEEADRLKTDTPDSDKDEDEEPPADGKITFKKPKKRATEESSDLKTSTSKKPKAEKSTKKTSSKNVKNSSLLSFDEDEDDDT